MRFGIHNKRRASLLLASVVLAAFGASAAFAASTSPTVSLFAQLSRTVLPRDRDVPVELHVDTTLGSNDGQIPPNVSQFTVSFNRHGRIDNHGLPTCASSTVEQRTAASALAACKSALVGHGTISGTIQFPDKDPFNATGKVQAFNGRSGGRDAILMQVEVTEPAPVAFVIPLVPQKTAGEFGTTFTATLPPVAGGFGTLTGLDLTMGRRYRFRGKRHSFLSASCPVPKGLPGGIFPLAEASYLLETGKTLSATAIGSCRAEGR